jgi:hypothetical protein
MGEATDPPVRRSGGDVVISYQRLSCGHHVPAAWPKPPYCAFCLDSKEAHELDEQLALHADWLNEVWAEYGRGADAPEWA